MPLIFVTSRLRPFLLPLIREDQRQTAHCLQQGYLRLNLIDFSKRANAQAYEPV